MDLPHVLRAILGLIMLSGAICLSGCTFIAGPKYETMALEAKPGKGLVVVYRRASVLGDGVRSRVWLDGKNIGKLPVESFITIDAEPGLIKLTIGPRLDEAFPTTDLDVHAGNIYYIRFRRRPLYDGLEAVDVAMARDELRGMTHIAHPEDA